MENKFNGKVWQIVSVVLACALILTVLKLNELSDQISSMQGQFTNTVNSLQSTVNSMYNRIENLLEKEASNITSASYTLGTPNQEDNTMPVSFVVTPKAYSNDTSISVVIGGSTYTAEKGANGVFTASFDMSIFQEDQPVTILINDGEKTLTEESDIYLGSLYSRVLPQVTTSFSGEGSYTFGKANISGNIFVHIIETEYSSPVSCRLITKINGTEVQTQELDINTDNDNRPDIYVDYYVSQAHTMARGDNLQMYVLVTDSWGYTHQKPVYSTTFTNDNQSITEVFNDGIAIYDKEGNTVFHS